MSQTNTAGQSATKTETLKTLIVKNTTSPDEKKHGSANYVLICPVSEILNLNIDKNLRIGYGNINSAKKETPIHREIRESFLIDPSRFVQRHTGFVILCDEIILGSPGDYGKNVATLSNASLINGAQTQQIIKDLFKDFDDNDKNFYKKVNVRVEIVVEKKLDEQGDIKVARNSSVNVTDLSRYGDQGVFDELQKSMTSYNPDWKIQLKETDTEISTQQVLQTVRLFVTDEMQDNDPSQVNIIKSYRNKAVVMNDFAKLHEDINKGSGYSELYEFFIEFAPIAWSEYLKWTHDHDWHKFFKKSENAKRIGRYSEKTKTFTLSWALVCPVLYGLKDFVTDDSKPLRIEYPKTFDKEKYMNQAFKIFKEEYDYVPQDFAKNTSSYYKLLRYAGSFK